MKKWIWLCIATYLFLGCVNEKKIKQLPTTGIKTNTSIPKITYYFAKSKNYKLKGRLIILFFFAKACINCQTVINFWKESEAPKQIQFYAIVIENNSEQITRIKKIAKILYNKGFIRKPKYLGHPQAFFIEKRDRGVLVHKIFTGVKDTTDTLKKLLNK